MLSKFSDNLLDCHIYDCYDKTRNLSWTAEYYFSIATITAIGIILTFFPRINAINILHRLEEV